MRCSTRSNGNDVTRRRGKPGRSHPVPRSGCVGQGLLSARARENRTAIKKDVTHKFMKRFQLALAAAVVASFAVWTPSPAQAYPVMMCTVSDEVVTGGEDVTVTAQVTPDTDSQWTLSYDGQIRNRTGNPVTATFDTDEVDEPTQTTVTATVTTEAGDSSTCTGNIVLLPRDGDSDGDGGDGGGGGDGDNGGLLPNTGGERLAWLIVGATLVLVGGGVVLASRRRDA